MAVSDAGLEHLGSDPADVVGDGVSVDDRGDGDAAAEFADGLVVCGAQRGRGELRVAHGHLGARVAEELHQRLEGHAGVHERGGVGVMQLVSNDAQRLPVLSGDSGGSDGVA